MNKIVFRADAGTDIGYGHFIRTLALADMLKDDFTCVFVTQSPTEYQKSEVEKVCTLIELPATEAKFDLFLNILQGDEIVILDNYFFDTDYQRKIKAKGCKLVCIDDMHDKHYVADVVINHGLTDKTLFNIESYTQLCLGLEWSLLRKPFLEVVPCAEREKGHWIVAFGGVDCYNLTLKFTKLLQESEVVKRITAIVGDGYKGEEQLKTLDKVHVVRKLSADAIVDLFCRVEYAILPASTITMEAIACGCTVFCGFFVDNQIEYYENLVCQHVVRPLGDLQIVDRERVFRDTNTNTYDLTKSKISNPIRNYHELFLGLSLRVVNYTELTSEESYRVWQIRNLPEIRQNMSDPHAFDFNSHCLYIEKLKANPFKQYWAAFINEECVGTYNLVNIHDHIAERGLLVVPEFQGKGIAQAMDKKMEVIFRELEIKLLKAEVLKTNVRSFNYHQKMGYTLFAQDLQFYYLQYQVYK